MGDASKSEAPASGLRGLLAAFVAGSALGTACGLSRALHEIATNGYVSEGMARLALAILSRNVLGDFAYFGVGFTGIHLAWRLVGRHLTGALRAIAVALLSGGLLADYALRRFAGSSIVDLVQRAFARLAGLLDEPMTLEAIAKLGHHYGLHALLLVAGACVAVLAAFASPWLARRFGRRRKLADGATGWLLRRRLLVPLFAFLVLIGVAGRLERRLGVPEGPNVVLVVVDTLAASHLGLYGYPRATSPVLDELGRRGIVFDGCLSQSSWTKTSMPSLMTGTYPVRHRVLGENDGLSLGFLTWAELFRRRGYRTAAFQTNYWLTPRFGFGQGFDEYVDLDAEKVGGDVQTDLALSWLRSHRARPFFLYVHYMDVHKPYRAPAGHRLFGDREVDLYDGAIHFVDEQIGRIARELERLAIDGETVFVVASDHGEEFGEHGGQGHGTTLYQEVVHVPLVILAPGLSAESGRRIPSFVANVDLLPTVLDLAGIDPGDGEGDGLDLHGRSLLPLIASAPAEPRSIYSQVDLPERSVDIFSAVTAEGLKLIVGKAPGGGGRVEIYDLAADRLENVDLLAAGTPAAALDVDRLLADYEALAGDGDEVRVPQVDLDADAQRRLKALGYLQ